MCFNTQVAGQGLEKSNKEKQQMNIKISITNKSMNSSPLLAAAMSFIRNIKSIKCDRSAGVQVASVTC